MARYQTKYFKNELLSYKNRQWRMLLQFIFLLFTMENAVAADNSQSNISRIKFEKTKK